MKKIKFGQSNLEGSAISLGCMRIAEMSVKDVASLISKSMDGGIDFFDHADIYGGGFSEEIFAKAVKMNSISREKMIIQSKCGIRKGFFDFSKEHILNSVDGSLKRLNTDYLDVLLLHRPDTLMEPEVVAEAFTTLEKSGKVRYFGVSNQNPMQIELLRSALKQPIIINQLQFSAAHTGIIDCGLNVNMRNEATINRDGSILEYSRLKNITIQSWSSLQYGFFEGVFLDNDKFTPLNAVLERLAKEYNVTKSAIAIAFILRHPAKIQGIIGSTNINRVLEMCKASDIMLSREHWYEIYCSAGNILP